MIDVIDFSSWNIYDGAAEGSGRSEKLWLQSNDGQIGLFKFPKIDPVSNSETTEHISEHLAHKLGNILNVPTARVDIGTYNGRIGSMSYFVCEDEEQLREGIWFISAKYPKYNVETMQDEEDGRYYCLDHIFDSLPTYFSNKVWIQMLLFDFVIGNSDRHQSNWAILVKIKFKEELSVRVRRCPLYDNGSSLCCYVNEEELPNLLGKDKNRFEALVDSKSRSLTRIDGSKKRLPTHREVVRHLLNKYSVAKEVAFDFIDRLNKDKIDLSLSEYDESILPKDKKELISRFLNRKMEILKELVEEAENNGK